MIVTELKEPGRSELMIFLTLSDVYAADVTDWISRKINSGAIRFTEDTKENFERLQDECERKFGERPHIVQDKDINDIMVMM